MTTWTWIRGQPTHGPQARDSEGYMEGAPGHGTMEPCHHCIREHTQPQLFIPPPGKRCPKMHMPTKGQVNFFKNSLCFDIGSRHHERLQCPSQIDGPFDGFSERGACMTVNTGSKNRQLL